VPLGRELDLLQHYMEIQRVRFGGTLTCEIDVPPATQPALAPVLVLQPLVENAVKHGFAGRAGGVIRVSARRAGDRLELTVSDNGRGVSGHHPGRRRPFEHAGSSRTPLSGQEPRSHQHAGNRRIVVALSLPWQVTPAAVDPQALDIPA
jgi:LytS/YehU family sensor histidine kinase